MGEGSAPTSVLHSEWSVMARPTPRELIRAHEELLSRAYITLSVIRHVLRKIPHDDVPPALAPVRSRLNGTLLSVHTSAADDSVELVLRAYKLTIPISLLSASDRDIATWTRSIVADAAEDARRRKKLSLEKQIAVATKMVARTQDDLARFQAELANLERDAA